MRDKPYKRWDVKNPIKSIKPNKTWLKLPTSTGERRISEPSTVSVWVHKWPCHLHGSIRKWHQYATRISRRKNEQQLKHKWAIKKTHQENVGLINGLSTIIVPQQSLISKDPFVCPFWKGFFPYIPMTWGDRMFRPSILFDPGGKPGSLGNNWNINELLKNKNKNSDTFH